MTNTDQKLTTASAAIEVTRVLVTPEMATQWLARNETNRAIRKSAVVRLAHDMAQGFWIETNPQPVIFDTSGALIDGQHRLAAVEKAGRSVWFWVARNVPKQTQLVIDDHIKRQLHDYAQWEMPGHKVKPHHVAISRVMVRGFSTNTTSLSRTDIYLFLREHFPAIEFALGVFTKRVPFITKATTYAVIARASYGQDRDRLRRFAEVLETGHQADPSEAAAVTLSRWLLERGERVRGPEKYGKTERALFSFLKGEALNKVYAAKDELFPLPQEQEKAVDVEAGPPQMPMLEERASEHLHR